MKSHPSSCRFCQVRAKHQKRFLAHAEASLKSRSASPFSSLSKDLLRTAIFSLLLFTVGFLGINAEAYSTLLKDSVLEWQGAAEESQLTAYIAPAPKPVQKLLKVERTSAAQKSQIPTLNLSVTPPDNRLIIPKIDKNIPLIESDPQKLIGADWQSIQETFQEDLKNGVIHYPGTAKPGQTGNAFITGHSSYYPWNPGRYKTVFARLSKLEVGDDIVVYYDQQKYRYKVREKKEVKSDDVSVLAQSSEKLLTLMTCSPVGTNIKRLVVVAELVE